MACLNIGRRVQNSSRGNNIGDRLRLVFHISSGSYDEGSVRRLGPVAHSW